MDFELKFLDNALFRELKIFLIIVGESSLSVFKKAQVVYKPVVDPIKSTFKTGYTQYLNPAINKSVVFF